jgi:diguanylate cyclase (GGDEF)-like protein/PAS domain S-box-containing protein
MDEQADERAHGEASREPPGESAHTEASRAAPETVEERFRTAFDHAPVGMALVGTNGVYLRVNDAFGTITGHSPEELIGRSFDEITHKEDLPAEIKYRARALDGEINSYTHEQRYRHRNGGHVWVRANVSLLRDARGDPLHFIAQVENVTDRKAVEERLLNHLLHDALTGLRSRFMFMDRLTQALARSERKQNPVAVLFVDLDHFKKVNDRYGHKAGDKVLVAVARTLEKAVRPSDTIARLAGDEFAVLCEDMSSERDAVLVAERLCAALNQPVDIDDHKLAVTASIGIAFAQEGDDPDSLLKHADAAMYKVKAGGRGTYEIYLDAL